jgi:hypothetical protein
MHYKVTNGNRIMYLSMSKYVSKRRTKMKNLGFEISHEQVTIILGDYSGRTVFAPSNIGVVGTNPTRGMDVCLCLFCVCVR